MHKIIKVAVAAASMLGAAAAPVEQAIAGPDPMIVFGVNGPQDRAVVERVQLYIWAGRHYCWYEGGWDGPGFYWCGYAWRRGWGWGGPWGWRGWYGPREWGERHGYGHWRDGDRGRWDGGDRGHWNGGERGHGDGGDHGRGNGGDRGHGDGGDRGHGDGDHRH